MINFVYTYIFFATAWTIKGSNPVRGQDIFLFFKTVQTVSGAHSAPNSWVRGPFHDTRGWDVQLTTKFQLLPRLRMGGAKPLLPSMSPWRGQGQF